MITVVVPVSPIKSHPNIDVITETVESVRHHLPSSEILLTFDGVRAEQEDRRADYEEAIRRTLWLADHVWGNVCPFIFDQHMHQSGMMRAALDEVRTPLLMYVEADCPLVTDELIAWPAVTDFVLSGESNLVRFHHEAMIPGAHQHMCHGTDHAGLFTLTSQWSQRPHVASTAYYRRIMASHFTSEARCFIEDKMHGVVDESYRKDGLAGWMQHRLHLYTPEGNIKRSVTLDGRAGEPKWDETQRF